MFSQSSTPLALIFLLPALAFAACNKTAISSTTYNVTAGETLYEVAIAVNRPVCQIARVNKMADPNYLTTGETILIPEYSCDEYDTSCFLYPSSDPGICIFGGPHTYITVLNDTVRYVALYKLNITVEALQNGGPTSTNVTDPDAILPVGSELKVPLCANGECSSLKPYSFEYGVLRDLAEEFHTTVGQIEAINFNYYHSSGGAPTLVLPEHCHCPAGKDCSEVLT